MDRHRQDETVGPKPSGLNHFNRNLQRPKPSERNLYRSRPSDRNRETPKSSQTPKPSNRNRPIDRNRRNEQFGTKPWDRNCLLECRNGRRVYFFLSHLFVVVRGVGYSPGYTACMYATAFRESRSVDGQNFDPAKYS